MMMMELGVSAIEGWQHFFTPFSIASYLIVNHKTTAEQIKKKEKVMHESSSLTVLPNFNCTIRYDTIRYMPKTAV
jgi:hypothetical protein